MSIYGFMFFFFPQLIFSQMFLWTSTSFCCSKQREESRQLLCKESTDFWIFAGLLVCCCSLINNAELTLALVFPEVGELMVTRWWSSADTRRSMKCCVILTRAVQVNKPRCQTQVSPRFNSFLLSISTQRRWRRMLHVTTRHMRFSCPKVELKSNKAPS